MERQLELLRDLRLGLEADEASEHEVSGEHAAAELRPPAGKGAIPAALTEVGDRRVAGVEVDRRASDRQRGDVFRVEGGVDRGEPAALAVADQVAPARRCWATASGASRGSPRSRCSSSPTVAPSHSSTKVRVSPPRAPFAPGSGSRCSRRCTSGARPEGAGSAPGRRAVSRATLKSRSRHDPGRRRRAVRCRSSPASPAAVTSSSQRSASVGASSSGVARRATASPSSAGRQTSSPASVEPADGERRATSSRRRGLRPLSARRSLLEATQTCDPTGLTGRCTFQGAAGPTEMIGAATTPRGSMAGRAASHESSSCQPCGRRTRALRPRGAAAARPAASPPRGRRRATAA